MPSIQVDLPLVADEAAKREFARRVGVIYGEIMQVGMDLLTVSIHDLGRGGCGAATSPARPHPPR